MALGMDQAEFSALVGVTTQTISDYETGRSSGPAKSTLRHLADRIGIPLESFGADGPNPASLVNRPLTARSGAPATLRGSKAGFGLRRATAAEVAGAEPRMVPRLALVELMQDMGADAPVDRLAWWLERAFEAGHRQAEATSRAQAKEGADR